MNPERNLLLDQHAHGATSRGPGATETHSDLKDLPLKCTPERSTTTLNWHHCPSASASSHTRGETGVGPIQVITI